MRYLRDSQLFRLLRTGKYQLGGTARESSGIRVSDKCHGDGEQGVFNYIRFVNIIHYRLDQLLEVSR